MSFDRANPPSRGLMLRESSVNVGLRTSHLPDVIYLRPHNPTPIFSTTLILPCSFIPNSHSFDRTTFIIREYPAALSALLFAPILRLCIPSAIDIS